MIKQGSGSGRRSAVASTSNVVAATKKKSVRFVEEEQNEIHSIERRCDIPAGEIISRWYDREDLASIRERNEVFVFMLSTGLLLQGDETSRGLESMIEGDGIWSKNSGSSNNSRRKRAIRAVLSEQNRLLGGGVWHHGEGEDAATAVLTDDEEDEGDEDEDDSCFSLQHALDAEALSKVYRKVATAAAQQEAQRRGSDDEKVALKILDPNGKTARRRRQKKKLVSLLGKAKRALTGTENTATGTVLRRS